MPNLENLIDQVAETLNTSTGEAWFTTLDLEYAYGQIPLHADTAKNCNFQIIRRLCIRYLLLKNRLLWINHNANRIPKDHGYSFR